MIYEKPSDYPNSFVVRRWRVTGEGPMPMEAYPAPTLKEARKFVPRELYRLPRDPSDDKTIVEVWI